MEKNPTDVNPADAYRPRAGLFCCECLRLLLLVVFLTLAPRENSLEGVLWVYLSANALFPMIALFVWLRPDEYGNYLTLHIAGKVVTLVSFFAWEIFSFRNFSGMENAAQAVLLLGCCLLLSLVDMFSVWRAWTMKNKIRKGTPSGRLRASGSDADTGREPENSFESGGI